MFKIVEYNRELLKDFVYDGVELKLFIKDQIVPMLEFYNKLGKSYIGLIDNRVIGIGGIYPLWENFGSAWLFLNKEAGRYKKSVFKILIKYMNSLVREYNLKTLILECINDSPKAHRLIQHLGFIKNREIKETLYFKQVRG